MSEKVITVTPEDQRKSNPKAAMVRTEVRSARGYANQRAHDLRIGPQPDYVDESRSYLNRILMPPPPAPEMRRMVEKRRAQRETSRALKSNAGIAVIGIVGFGIEAAQLFGELTTEQQDAAVLEAGRRIAEIANTTMVGAVIHLDETSTHAHLSFCGYDLDGVPLSSTMKRGMLTQFQDVLAEVMSEHCPGIERGNSKWNRIKVGADYAETVHKSVRELHQDLPKDIAKKREELEQVSAEIPKLEARVTEMQARVDKLENEEKQRELTAAKVKRLRTYRSRLTDRIGDLRGARDELNRLTAEIEAKQKLVTDLERRADQAEERAARATERAQEAKQTASAAEERKSEVEASVAALEAEKAILTTEVSNLTDVRDQLQPEVTFLQSKKEKLSVQAQEAEERATEAQKQAVKAKQRADEAEWREKAAKAATDALSARMEVLENNVEAAERRKAFLEAKIINLSEQKDSILNEGRKLLRGKKALETKVAELEETSNELDHRNKALKMKFASVQKDLEFLRPAIAAADFLQQVSALDPEEELNAWEMMYPPQDHVPIMYASAVRMVDPLFAPEIPVPRSAIVGENLETLRDCPEEDYWAIVDAVKAEDGAEEGIEALTDGLVHLNTTGTVAPSNPDQESSGVFWKALKWVKNTFDGVKRGVGLALATTRDEISEELTAAQANLFNAFEPKLRLAIRHLLKAETRHKSPMRQRSDPEQDLSDDFKP